MRRYKKLISLILGVLIPIVLSSLSSAGYINLPAVTPVQKNTTPGQTFSYATDTPFYISKVVDGDTIDISQGEDVIRVRLIGINSPESVDPRRPVECYGKEASQRAKELLSGKSVTIELDPSQGKYDKYGRLLAYAYLPDGTSFNQEMINEGYAYEYTYNKEYKYQKTFKVTQCFKYHPSIGSMLKVKLHP